MRKTLAILALAAAFAAGCRDPRTALEQLLESRRLAAELSVQFIKADDAANRAVMADTDETSASFSGEAKRARQAVLADVAALRSLLDDQRYAAETGILDEFAHRFAEYETIDGEILDLAVLNTNLKAQRVSFGPAATAADAFRDALKGLAPASAANAARLDALAMTALASVREIQALQAPHIAESDDAMMTTLEARMKAADTTARGALQAMTALIAPQSRPSMTAATTALDQFSALNAQILDLSRRNSNVRSLALSLGQKRAIVATCEERLQALQDALAKRDVGSTR